MGAVATAEAAWLTVRCPCDKNTLAEVRGAVGEVRRYCNRCKVWRIVDVCTGAVRVDPSQGS